MKSMNKDPIDPRLEAYLALCQRMFERLHRDGKLPWKQEDFDEEDTEDN
ncbi:hypothetical protein [Minwuia sp.]